MDELEMRHIINDYIKEICHYSQMQVFATSSYQKNYFQMQIDEAVEGLMNYFLVCSNASIMEFNTYRQQEPKAFPDNPYEYDVVQAEAANELREITAEELAMNNGGDGRNAYVAVNGSVYDVTKIIGWAGGTHFGLFAGKDLSGEFMGCHNGMVGILKNIPKIGILKEKK